MKWFRFYSEALHDPKVQRLSGNDFKAWVNLLCLANDGDPRGSLPESANVGFALRMSTPQAERLISRFEALGFLDADYDGPLVRVHNWDKWQPETDDVTARVTAWRDRRKRAGNVTSNVTGNVQETNLYGADPDQIQNRTETETETDRVPPLPRLFEHAFGRPVTPMDVEELRALEEEHPREAIDYALREAADANARNLRYVKSILENQKARGYDCQRAEHPRGRVAEADGLTAADRAAIDRLGIGRSRFILDPWGDSEGGEGEHPPRPESGLEVG